MLYLRKTFVCLNAQSSFARADIWNNAFCYEKETDLTWLKRRQLVWVCVCVCAMEAWELPSQNISSHKSLRILNFFFLTPEHYQREHTVVHVRVHFWKSVAVYKL